MLAVAIQKGGCGKTTTAVAIAHRLAQHGRRVVLIDLDAQGNVAPCLGIPPAGDLFRWLILDAPLRDVCCGARPNLWVIRGDSSTAKLKTALAGEAYRETILARKLAPLSGLVDFVVLDTSPGRDILIDNAHHAAQDVVVPVALDHLALLGVAQEFETLQQVRGTGHPAQVLAVLPTFFDPITRESEHNLQRLAETFGDLVLGAVPRTTRLREAPAHGKSVWEYLPADSSVAQAYDRLVRRILDGR